MIQAARKRKDARAGTPRGALDSDAPLTGRMLALIFEKPSTRTRISFDVGVQELGGRTIVLTGAEMQLGRGETIADTARVLSRYVDAVMIRTLDHAMLLELAEHAAVPVINGLTKLSHPCQVMADVMTFEEKKGPHPRPRGGLDRRLQQCLHLVDSCRRPFRLRLAGGDAGHARPPRGLAQMGPQFRSQDRFHQRRRGCGDGCGLRGHRHLGVDGR